MELFPTQIPNSDLSCSLLILKKSELELQNSHLEIQTQCFQNAHLDISQPLSPLSSQPKISQD